MHTKFSWRNSWKMRRRKDSKIREVGCDVGRRVVLVQNLVCCLLYLQYRKFRFQNRELVKV
jgi:hypothetical protein